LVQVQPLPSREKIAPHVAVKVRVFPFGAAHDVVIIITDHVAVETDRVE